MKKYEKCGKPVTHPPIKHVETGKVYKTYLEAAEAIGGNRWGVRLTALGIQSSHFGQHFKFVKNRK